MTRRIGLTLMGAAGLGLLALLPHAPAAPATPMPGAAVFQDKGCTQCHGPAGLGTDKGPSLAGVGKRRDRAGIEQQIREGGGAMPAFGDILTDEEVQDLSAWLVLWKSKSAKHPH